MLLEKRKKGAQPGNFNALRHGRRSPRKRAERRAARDVALAEERRTAAQWMASIPETDYAAICDGIASAKARRAGGLN